MAFVERNLSEQFLACCRKEGKKGDFVESQTWERLLGAQLRSSMASAVGYEGGGETAVPSFITRNHCIWTSVVSIQTSVAVRSVFYLWKVL